MARLYAFLRAINVGGHTVAMTSGNIGTLVRHRGLALPYLVWLSAVGACDLVRWMSRPAAGERLSATRAGAVSFEVQPTWR
jgi:hypothetical protein